MKSKRMVYVGWQDIRELLGCPQDAQIDVVEPAKPKPAFYDQKERINYPSKPRPNDFPLVVVTWEEE